MNELVWLFLAGFFIPGWLMLYLYGPIDGQWYCFLWWVFYGLGVPLKICLFDLKPNEEKDNE